MRGPPLGMNEVSEGFMVIADVTCLTLALDSPQTGIQARDGACSTGALIINGITLEGKSAFLSDMRSPS